MAFGLTSTCIYKWIKFSRRVLLFVLHKYPQAMVTKPTGVEIERYVAAVGARWPLVLSERVWGASDGIKLHIQRSNNYAIQNKYHNGWTKGTYVNSVFVFAPDGRI